MLRKLTYISIFCFCMFALALFLTFALQSLVFAYIAMALVFFGSLISFFGIIGPILFFHMYHNVLSRGQKEVIKNNPLTRLMVYIGSDGKENFD
jgi:Na+/proline symporter